MKNLNMNLKKHIDESYTIDCVHNVGNALGDFLGEKKYSKALIVCDTNVSELYLDDIASQIDKNICVETLVIDAGEENKTLESAMKICEKLIDIRANRNDCIVALGGGVIGDMVGFAGSIFKRGMDVIQIPTTLLSMFDSSVGGKTGVDYGDIKNIIGNFKQPQKVLINSDFLSTLPEGEIRSGYFEGLKHSLIDSPEYFQEFIIEGEKILSLSNKEADTISRDELHTVLLRNISVKARIVMEDEHELGVRKFLNYGHTFGHALESMSNFSLAHGICVGYGMLYVNILSHKLGFLSSDNLRKINSFILSKLPQPYTSLLKRRNNEGVEFEDIYQKMTSDKKNIDANISFTLLDEPGKLHIEKIGVDKKDVLEECFEELKELIR